MASIVWLGYDSPGADFGAGSPEAAIKGAPAYANFVSGLRASNSSGQCPHITSIGHSYGSVVVGQATKMATHNGNYTLPDDVVLIGSPGTGVDRAADLRLPGHVWAAAADNDLVTHAVSGRGMIPWPLGSHPDENYFGRDPASESFGAKRFTVSDYSQGANLLGAHTKYLTPQFGGPSLGNIASIVTGKDSDVHLIEGR